MSVQNKKTIEAYQTNANRYLENNYKIDKELWEESQKNVQHLMKELLSSIPKDGRILEIGSADGEIASYIKSLGYDITASDIADDFIKEITKKGLEPIKFNLLEDEFKDKYNCIICWKVFVHFTDNDVLKALEKIYDALDDNGIVIFNLISGDQKDNKEEWIDFPDNYSIGIDRYFRYYLKEDMDTIISKTDFKIFDYKEEIGVEKIKWLIYVLKK